MKTQQDINDCYQWVDTLKPSKKTLKRFKRRYEKERRNSIILFYITFILVLILITVL